MGTTLLPGQRKRGTVPAYYSTADVFHLLMINPSNFPRSIIFPKPLLGTPCLHYFLPMLSCLLIFIYFPSHFKSSLKHLLLIKKYIVYANIRKDRSKLGLPLTVLFYKNDISWTEAAKCTSFMVKKHIGYAGIQADSQSQA